MLLLRGELRAGEDVLRALAGVPWHDLNKRFKRDYDAAVAQVLTGLPADGPGADEIQAAVDDVMHQLDGLDLQRAGRGRRPPKAGA